MTNVLIVDDEKSIRFSLRAFLEAGGYTVETAADAQEALRLLGDGNFDVVVSDIVSSPMRRRSRRWTTNGGTSRRPKNDISRSCRRP